MGKRRLTRSTDTKVKRRSRSAWITWAVLGGLVLVIGGFVAYLMTQGPAQMARTGNPAPDFTLRLLNGQSVTLSSLRGRPVLVNFWHST
ncbi:MAG: AhpC/TSA family [candidate division NC10 bacterium]|jgi:cytochrome c biogenesis protein CcmG/thiol:disulfide interchange protein DsbE|nr:AhpC/TSA family [candidate division NC10 bacterium]MBS1116805.1 AhpC/TSA family [candidate division NC10 bacterium]